MTGIQAQKAAARNAGFERRALAHQAYHGDLAQARLLEFLEPHAGKTISGYMPIRTEIDPLPVMAKMAASGFVTVPVIERAGQPLKFRQWMAGCEMLTGPFGAKIPATGEWLEPQVLIVPLVAFDRDGARLGYGGGYYDRTLALLRGRRNTIAVGFAYGAQQADTLPMEPTDQPLDALITERDTLIFKGKL